MNSTSLLSTSQLTNNISAQGLTHEIVWEKVIFMVYIGRRESGFYFIVVTPFICVKVKQKQFSALCFNGCIFHFLPWGSKEGGYREKALIFPHCDHTNHRSLQVLKAAFLSWRQAPVTLYLPAKQVNKTTKLSSLSSVFFSILWCWLFCIFCKWRWSMNITRAKRKISTIWRVVKCFEICVFGKAMLVNRRILK